MFEKNRRLIFCFWYQNIISYWLLGAMTKNELSPFIFLGLFNTYCMGYSCIDIKSIYGSCRLYWIMIGIVSPKFITLYCITYMGPINETVSRYDQLLCRKTCCSSWTSNQENMDELNYVDAWYQVRSGWNLVLNGHILVYFFGVELSSPNFV